MARRPKPESEGELEHSPGECGLCDARRRQEEELDFARWVIKQRRASAPRGKYRANYRSPFAPLKPFPNWPGTYRD
jgi:hypothetical protein